MGYIATINPSVVRGADTGMSVVGQLQEAKRRQATEMGLAAAQYRAQAARAAQDGREKEASGLEDVGRGLMRAYEARDQFNQPFFNPQSSSGGAYMHPQGEDQYITNAAYNRFSDLYGNAYGTPAAGYPSDQQGMADYYNAQQAHTLAPTPANYSSLLDQSRLLRNAMRVPANMDVFARILGRR